MTQQKQNGNIVAIIVMIFLFGMISFVTNLASPMGDILKFQFGVPNWMGTLGVFANFIAYAVMGYPAGNMLQKMAPVSGFTAKPSTNNKRIKNVKKKTRNKIVSGINCFRLLATISGSSILLIK